MHHLHIFLSSPGDVSRERQLARQVIGRLQSERAHRDWLKLEVVAWDTPGVGTPMPAQLEPQEAINRGLKKPSQCDIVIVIFWARMGTPLSENYRKPDGSRYRSGTEYEFLEALEEAKKTDKPEVLVYWRENGRMVHTKDPNREEENRQWDLVETFFSESRNPDGSCRWSFCSYEEPSQFKEILDEHLRDIITRYREAHPPEKGDSRIAAIARKEPAYERPPFPGLRAFTSEEALIFYGRGREIDDLMEKMSDAGQRFLAVVGASGSGKSSLVAAGLLPALEKNALPGSGDWRPLRCTPAEVSDNPFMELASAIKAKIQRPEVTIREVAQELERDPGSLEKYLAMLLEGKPPWAELLLFLDQFEEFFTLVDAKYRHPFVELLARAAQTARVRTVLTMRADFYARCLEWPVLNELFAEGHFALLPPKMGALHEMITRPAQRAGLAFEEGLVQRILEDTGTEPGALALMAFALHELWKKSKEAGPLLTCAAYDSFHGVSGAIGQRAEETFACLEGEKAAWESALGRVFRDLVEVDERGVATRRRAPLQQVTGGAAEAMLVDALTKARLLVTDCEEGKEPMVEVAHEALFASWPRLRSWIEATSDDLRMRRQVHQATAEWKDGGEAKKYLWTDERVVEVVGMLGRLGLGVKELTEEERRFLGPIDRDSMLKELEDPATSHERRALIGVRLSLLGDPRAGVGLRPDGLPDIAWCKVPGGEISLEEGAGTFRVKPFYIAKYPLTWRQYRTFRGKGRVWQSHLVGRTAVSPRRAGQAIQRL